MGRRSNSQKYVDTLMTKAVIYFPIILYKIRKHQYLFFGGLFTIVTTVATVRKMLRLYRAHALRVKRQRCQNKQLEIRENTMARLKDKVSADTMQSVLGMDIVSLQSQLHTGQLDPLIVLHCFQIKALEQNLQYNFIVELLTEAEEEAKALSQSTDKKGLLYGLPISVKEHIAIKGYDVHIGQSALLEQPATEDAVIVKVLRLHGGIPFLHSNLPQLSNSYESSNPIVGQTVNPHDPDRSPGGSSGGEGAAIASGSSILGIGSDLGGSIRVPSHYCGVCGLKPTYGRISIAVLPKNPQVVDKLDILPGVLGPLSSDMAGLTLLSRALMSQEMFQLDRSMIPVPFREEMFNSTKKLRIGYFLDNHIFTPVPPVQRAVLQAVQILKDCGHEVFEVEFDDDGEVLENAIAGIFSRARSVDRMQATWKVLKYDEIDPCIDDMYHKCTYPVWFTNLRAAHLQFVEKKRFEGKLWKSWQGTRLTSNWQKLRHKKNLYRDHHLSQWRWHGLDAMLCPVTGLVAPPLGVANQIDHPAYVYTRLYNMVDFPAGSVPVTTVTEQDVIATQEGYRTDIEHEDGHKVMEGAVGLPVGVQVASLPYQEEVVLRIMKLIEDKAGYRGSKRMTVAAM